VSRFQGAWHRGATVTVITRRVPMRRSISLSILVMVLSLSTGEILAAVPKEAKPSMAGREDAVTGTLVRIDGGYYMIQDKDGKVVQLQVDMSTKLDKVVEGDMVTAYYTKKGHATTLERTS
jgi:hypothetical protein